MFYTVSLKNEPNQKGWDVGWRPMRYQEKYLSKSRIILGGKVDPKCNTKVDLETKNQ